MANEDEIIAVFRADIDQYKVALADKINTDKQAIKTQDDLSKATTNYATKTKTAGSAIKNLSQGLGGLTGLLAVSGRLLGFNTSQLQDLIFASSQFVSVGRNILSTQKLVNAATVAGTAANKASEVATVKLTIAERVLNAVRSLSLPIIGAIAAALGATAAVLIRYKDQIFGLTEAQKDLMRASDGTIIADENLRDSYNKTIIVIRDLNIEHRLITGEINEYQASLERLKNKNKQDVDAINKDTKEKLGEVVGVYAQIKLGIASALGLGGLEAKRIIDEGTKLISGRNELLKIKEEELTDQQKIELDKRFAQIDEDTKRLLKANQDRIDKEKEAAKKAREEELKELREWQKEKNDINVQAAEENLILLRKQAEVAREELEEQEKMFVDFLKDINKEAENATVGVSEEFQEIIESANKGSKEALETLRLIAAMGVKQSKDAQKALDDIRDKEIEDTRKMLITVSQLYQEAFEKRQKLREDEITEQEKNIDTQRSLAERGLANTLDFEERRAAELRRQQQVEAERNKRLKLLETFLNALADFSKDDAKNALPKALLQVALATTASAAFGEEGGIIGEIKERSYPGRRHKSGRDVLLHAEEGEGLLPKRSMDIIGRRNFELLRNVGRHPVRDDIFKMPKIEHGGGVSIVSNEDVVKEIKHLQTIIKNKKETHYDLKQNGEYLITMVEDGIKTKTSGKLRKPKWRS